MSIMSKLLGLLRTDFSNGASSHKIFTPSEIEEKFNIATEQQWEEIYPSLASLPPNKVNDLVDFFLPSLKDKEKGPRAIQALCHIHCKNAYDPPNSAEIIISCLETGSPESSITVASALFQKPVAEKSVLEALQNCIETGWGQIKPDNRPGILNLAFSRMQNCIRLLDSQAQANL